VQERIKLFVVLLEAEELSSNFKDWPKSISLAVCLLPTGEHHFVVFHVEELSKICPRLERQLGLVKDEFEIYPEVEGYKSRSMLFSDTQLIWSLVARTQEVLEEAVDFSENYRFAKEEGLDPTSFLGLEPSDVQSDANVEAANTTPAHHEATIVEFVSRRAGVKTNSDQTGSTASDKSITQLPGFLRPNHARPIPSYMNVRELEEHKHAPDNWTVHAEKDGWILIERASQGDLDLEVAQQSQIFLQKNRQKLAVRLATVPGQRPQLPNRIRFRTDILPLSIQRALVSRLNIVSFSQLGYFLYLSIEPALNAGEIDPLPVAALHHKSRPQAGLQFNRNFRFPVLSQRRSISFVRKKGVQASIGMASLVLMIFVAINLSDDAQAGSQVEGREAVQQSLGSEPSVFLRFFKNILQ
jgi:hypothetical protein